MSFVYDKKFGDDYLVVVAGRGGEGVVDVVVIVDVVLHRYHLHLHLILWRNRNIREREMGHNTRAQQVPSLTERFFVVCWWWWFYVYVRGCEYVVILYVLNRLIVPIVSIVSK